ncbi:MAG: efflux RND transporter permease subunit, partial [Lysobacterales bacterium]
LIGARELAWPVVAMTTTLVAVYLPIGFLGGLTGTLFVEFAFTLAGAVLLSGVIALTLSPMLCAYLLKPRDQGQGRLATWLDARFDGLRQRYRRRLHGALETPSVIAVFGLIVLVSCWFLFTSSNTELAPEEDQGFVFAIGSSDPYSTLDYLQRYSDELTRIAADTEEVDNIFQINGMGGGGGGSTSQAIAGFVLKPWSERERSTKQVLEQDLTPQINQIAGLNTFAVQPPALPTPGGDGTPIQMVIGSTGDLQSIQELAGQILERAYASRKFIFLDTDLKIDKPRVDIIIDRDKAALLGIDMRTLGADMAAMLSGGYANRFALANRSYRVIPQVQRADRLNPEQLGNYYTRTRSGELVPLSTLVHLEHTVQPQTLKRFQQLNAVTISGVPWPGVTLGEALATLDDIAAELLPPGYNVDYAGQSRQLKTEGSALMMTFVFALIVIYLVLAAQFESWRDPLIMLVTVPMAICGAMIFVSLGITTLNIYTQVGLVTLIGVISKHGILIVEFANKLQREQGRSRRVAIEEAAAIRLRPVLMTTAALVFAMAPLLIATGAGAASRFSMGLVIATGMTLGTAFTLFVLPAMYLYLARDHGRGEPEPAPGHGTPGSGGNAAPAFNPGVSSSLPASAAASAGIGYSRPEGA